jgi:D-alanyl-lipoteichoic acid acyltransferase DltB (MBOAT superfamily)
VLFNTFDFGFFLVVVYTLYWTIGIKNRKSQNTLLLLASYVFYGLWDWRFLILLLLSSLVDFIAGKKIYNASAKLTQRLWLFFSVFWNLGILILFKYFGFFINSFNSLFEITSTGYTFWNVAIPVGLSFYTFQTLSYTLDVYRKRIKPTQSWIDFFGFVSFFPQLVAGPIERAGKLIPQFTAPRSFNLQKTKQGLRQILWGLFKKVLVADKLGLAVNLIFDTPQEYGAITLLYGGVLFAFQLYCDFSGYTDIAIGTAKLFGFNLSKNFKTPYLAKTISEFWQRWHITLTRWFTDYVYIPLVRQTKEKVTYTRYIALLITMVLVGLWHGANWTFVAFGLVNGFAMVLERISLKGKQFTIGTLFKKSPRLISTIYVFSIFTVSSIFFRSENIQEAFFILKRIFTLTPDTHLSTLIGFKKLSYLFIMLIAEIATQKWDFPLQYIETKFPRFIRWILYYILIILLIRYAETQEPFIYFQF